MRTAIGPSFVLIAISPRFVATFLDFPLQEAITMWKALLFASTA
jgi:hypothetical protein